MRRSQLDWLYLKARELAEKFSASQDTWYQRHFERADGFDIPADTQIVVTVELRHIHSKLPIFDRFKIEKAKVYE